MSALNLADETETPTEVVNGVLQGITSFPRLADPDSECWPFV